VIGQAIGPYQILAELGRGGMGEVYRAQDTKLNRDVAIKVLPEAFAADADRLARFTREAQVLASLNHPNIAAIYGIEQNALVMELVDGHTLEELIRAKFELRRSNVERFEWALPIAKQVADALECAHENGIIHRDLKPANIKVRADGTVKVLDFGLAKAMAPAESSPSAVANSPTLTARATQMGMILGTAAYMAPEQARGRAVDRRADVWAFGVVLYEMLTGKRAFDGDDISITLASVLKEDVNWQALPADLPVPMRRLLRRCLEKDPKRRLSSIGDARLELEEALSPVDRDGSGVAALASTAAAAPVVVPAWRRVLPWGVAAALGAALISALVVWPPWRTASAPTARRLLTHIGADASLVVDRAAAAILSPDGTTLVFVAQQAGQTRLFMRKLDQLQASPLAGTDNAAYPFFSPDGQWIAFFAGGKLKKVSVAGGAPVDLCAADSGRGGTWADDDTIYFSPAGGLNNPLRRVPAAGGKPDAFGTLSEGAQTQRWPHPLPGGKAVLYTEHAAVAGFDAANIVIAPVSKGSAKAGPSKVLVRGAYYGRYVPSGLGSPKRSEREGGHLLYIQQGTLFAVAFDPVRLETTGTAVPAIEGLTSSSSAGGAQVAFSSDGTVVYVPGVAASSENPLDWVTRGGKTSVLRAEKFEWASPRFSPDGQRIAMDISDGRQRDVFVYDLARDSLTQLTFDPGMDLVPVWTLDGKRIVFASDRAKPGASNLYVVNADGTGDVTRLTESPDDERPFSWHPSGKFLAFGATRAGSWDALMLPMEDDATKAGAAGKPSVFLGTPAQELGPMFSPDGRFIAYFSTEAGGSTFDVYVRQFPGPGGRWRVTTTGAAWPRWSATTPELLWIEAVQGKVMSAPYTVVGDAFSLGKPELWSPSGIRTIGMRSNYDLHPDGKRIAAAADRTQVTVQDHVVIMSNFFEYLRTIAPVKK
jgi:serine/threonine-protein kinase